MPSSDPEVRRAFEAGAAAHPGLPLGFDAFERGRRRMAAARDARRAAAKDGTTDCETAGAQGDAPPAQRDDSAADAFLAIACDDGVPGSWDVFVRTFAPRIHGLLRSRGATDAEAAEFVADLPGVLCEAPSDGRARTRIGTYDGSGSLFSWLAVVALRTAHQRRTAAAARPAQIDEITEAPARRAPPPSAAVGAETARRFEAAVATAWESLTPRERLAVLLKYRDGLRQREVAKILGVGEPRVSRLLESGLSRLRDAVHDRMAESPPGTDTPDAALRQALAAILARHMASSDPPPHERPVEPDV